MTRSSTFQAVIIASVAVGAICAGAGTGQAQFKQTNLVSDMPGLARITDPNLKNPWGVAFAKGESRLGFEAGHKYGPALSHDG